MSVRRIGRMKPGGRLGLGATPFRDHLLADHPLGYWRLDEASGAILDSSAAGKMGMSATGSGFTYHSAAARNVDGFSLAFTGSGGFSSSFPAILGFANTFSAEALVKFTSAGTMTWLCIDQEATGLQNGRQFNCRAAGGKGDFVVYCGGSAGASFVADTAVTCNDGNWHHLVCTYVGNTMCIYLDGVLSGTTTTTGSLNPNQGGSMNPFLTLGSSNNNTPANFARWSGSLDEVAIFDYALSAARIAERYSLLAA